MTAPKETVKKDKADKDNIFNLPSFNKKKLNNTTTEASDKVTKSPSLNTLPKTKASSSTIINTNSNTKTNNSNVKASLPTPAKPNYPTIGVYKSQPLESSKLAPSSKEPPKLLPKSSPTLQASNKMTAKPPPKAATKPPSTTTNTQSASTTQNTKTNGMTKLLNGNGVAKPIGVTKPLNGATKSINGVPSADKQTVTGKLK